MKLLAALAIAAMPEVINDLIKDPVKKRKLRNVCKQIFDSLKIAFAGDEGFQ